MTGIDGVMEGLVGDVTKAAYLVKMSRGRGAREVERRHT